jgi:hypothetical protein
MIYTQDLNLSIAHSPSTNRDASVQPNTLGIRLRCAAYHAKQEHQELRLLLGNAAASENELVQGQ